MIYRFIFLILLFPCFVFSQDQTSEINHDLWVISQSTPYEFWKIFRDTGLDSSYKVNVKHLNPFYYLGDFDGDKKTDYVVILTDKKKSRDRLAILGGNKKIYWLDHDDELIYPSLTAWHIYPKSWDIEQGADENESPPTLIGDALMIKQVEASSALIYWNGKRFVSYWQGD